jgi:outer membrane receptor protein involved in Fe transport
MKRVFLSKQLAALTMASSIMLLAASGFARTVLMDYPTNSSGGLPPGVTVIATSGGGWSTFGTAPRYQYGGFSRHDNNSSKGQKAIRYTPVLPKPGLYEVQAWWPVRNGSESNVPVRVYHKGETSDQTFSQNNNGGYWISIGTFDFAADGTEYAEIRNDDTTTYVMADAMRFVDVSSSVGHAQLSTNYSSSCRRGFGAGLYDSVSNKTYVCWGGAGMSVFIRAYDHATSAWGEPKEICPLTYTSRYDYHNYPVLNLAPDGHLLVHFCEHAHKMFQLRAPAANSADGDWVKTEISADATCYPMPVVAGADIWLFYSKNDDNTWPYRTYRYIKSTDNGQTWSAPATVIDSEKADPDKYDEVYAWNFYYNPATLKIGLTWTMAGGTSHNSASKDLYFAHFNTTSGHMENVKGEDLGETIKYSGLEGCRVVKRQGNPAASMDKKKYPITDPQPSYNSISRKGAADAVTHAPVIAFGEHNFSTLVDSLRCARWDDTAEAWQFSDIYVGEKGFGDFEKTGDNTFRVIYKHGDNVFIKHTLDGGVTWRQFAASAIPYSGDCDKVGDLQFIENNQLGAVAFAGMSFTDTTKPGGYNYNGVFHTHVFSESGDTTAPVFLVQPAGGANVLGGNSLTLSAVISANPPPACQWEVDKNDGDGFKSIGAGESNYTGATSDTLTIISVGAEMDGWQYRLAASNGDGGIVTSDSITIDILEVPVVDENPLAEVVVLDDGSAIIAASVSSVTDMTCQWQVNKGDGQWISVDGDDPNYTGVDTATLGIAVVSPEMQNWKFRLAITNDAGTNYTNSGEGTTIRVMARHFLAPVALAFDGAGNLYVSDADYNTVFQIDAGGSVHLFAGGTAAGWADRRGVDARFSAPHGLARFTGTTAAWLVADTANAALRTLSPTAGAGTLLTAADGLSLPAGVVVHSSGRLFIADSGKHVIHVVSRTGAVSIYAGAPGESGYIDATGTAARFNKPTALALDGDGNLYVADTGNDAVRVVMPLNDTTGVADTLASGTGDGIFAPRGLAVTGTGDGLHVYLANTDDSSISDISAGGVVTTLAGVSGSADFKDGTGTGARFNHPEGIAIGGDGLYVADTGNTIIRKIVLTGGTIATVSTPVLTTGSSYGGAAEDHQRPVSAGGKGGGAPSPWFMLSIAALAAVRFGRQHGKITVKDYKIVVLPALALVLAPLPAPAQSPAAPSDEIVELTPFEVTAEKDLYAVSKSVSATRFASEIQKVPVTIQVITDQFMNDIGAFGIEDVYAYATGINYSQQGGQNASTGTSYTVRGFSAPETRINGFRGGTLFLNRATLDRVEVARGPQAVLYGQGSAGGTVNSITKSAPFRKRESARLTMGSYNLFQTDLDIGGPLGKNLAYRIVAQYHYNETITDWHFLEDTVIYPTFTWKAGKNVVVNARYSRFSRNTNRGSTVYLASDIPGLRNYYPTPEGKTTSELNAEGQLGRYFVRETGQKMSLLGPDAGYDYDIWSASGDITVRLGRHVTYRGAFQKADTDRLIQDRVGMNNNLAWNARDKNEAIGEAGSSGRNRHSEYHNDDTEMRHDLLLDFNTGAFGLKILLGFEKAWLKYDRLEVETPISSAKVVPITDKYGDTLDAIWSYANMSVYRLMLTNPDSALLGSANSRHYRLAPWPDAYTDASGNLLRTLNGNPSVEKTDSAAYYATMLLDLFSDRLHLIGGLRYDDNDFSVISQKATLAREFDFRDEYDTNKSSWQAGVTFDLTRQISLYANYSTTFVPNNKTDKENKPLGPQTGEGVDAGIKANLFRGKMAASIVYFNTKRAGIPRMRYDHGLGESHWYLSGKEKAEGVEIEINFRPVPAWRIMLNAMFLDGVIVSNEEDPLVEGWALSGAPKRRLNLLTSYKFPSGPLKDLQFGLGMNHSPSMPLHGGRYIDQYIKSDSYTIYSVFASYPFKAFGRRLTVGARVDNLFDKVYIPRRWTWGKERTISGYLQVNF